LPVSTAQPSGFVRPVNVKAMIENAPLPRGQEVAANNSKEQAKSAVLRNPELPFLVTARSTHLPPAKLPSVDGASRLSAPKTMDQLTRPDSQERPQPESPRPRHALAVQISHSPARVSRPSERQEEPRAKPLMAAGSRLPVTETPLAEQTQTAQPLMAPPQPAAQLFLPSPGSDAPLVPQRIRVAVVASTITPDLKANPVKSITLQLHPAELGAVTVTVRLKPGEIALRVEAETEKTLILLQRDENVLRQVLHTAGYDGEQASLSIVLKPAGEPPLAQPISQPSPASSGRDSASLAGSQSDLSHSDQRQGQPHNHNPHTGTFSYDDEPLHTPDRPHRGLFV